MPIRPQGLSINRRLHADLRHKNDFGKTFFKTYLQIFLGINRYLQVDWANRHAPGCSDTRQGGVRWNCRSTTRAKVHVITCTITESLQCFIVVVPLGEKKKTNLSWIKRTHNNIICTYARAHTLRTRCIIFYSTTYNNSDGRIVSRSDESITIIYNKFNACVTWLVRIILYIISVRRCLITKEKRLV